MFNWSYELSRITLRQYGLKLSEANVTEVKWSLLLINVVTGKSVPPNELSETDFQMKVVFSFDDMQMGKGRGMAFGIQSQQTREPCNELLNPVPS